MEHNVGPMQQSSVQHLASQMNQLQMSGSQYITSPVHGSFSQASWQMMHQHGQPQHPHAHYMSLEVRNSQSDSYRTFKCVDQTLACGNSNKSYNWATFSYCTVDDRVWFILCFRTILLLAKGILLGRPCHHKRQGYHSTLLTTLSRWRTIEWQATRRLINKGEQCIWCLFHTR